MAFSAIGLDLGTYNIKIYNGINDSISTHKNMIAIQNKRNVLAYGDEAFKMYEGEAAASLDDEIAAAKQSVKDDSNKEQKPSEKKPIDKKWQGREGGDYRSKRSPVSSNPDVIFEETSLMALFLLVKLMVI